MSNAPSCNECMFFDAFNQEYWARQRLEDGSEADLPLGRCRFNPPVRKGDAYSSLDPNRGEWPEVYGTDWCAQWRSPTGAVL